MFNNNAGGVGVGTSAPTGKFNVVGDSVVTGGDLTVSDPNRQFFGIENTSSGRYMHISAGSVTSVFGYADVGGGGLTIAPQSSFGGASVGSQFFFMDRTGQLGLSTLAPTADFHINQTGAATGDAMRVDVVGAGANPVLVIDQSGRIGMGGRIPTTNALEVDGVASKNTGTAWATHSDRRLKDDIHDLQNGIVAINRLRPVRFKYNDTAGTTATSATTPSSGRG